MRLLRVLRRLLLLAVLALGGLVASLLLTTPGPRPSAGWRRLADLPQPRGEVASAAVPERGVLVVAGGIEGVGRTVRTVSVLQLEASRWTRGPSLPAPRNHAAAASLGGTVYLTGGSPSTTRRIAGDNLWALEPKGRWRRLEPMPEGRWGHAMVALGGRLYVVGGAGPSARTLVYAPGAGWRTAAPLPLPRDHLVAVVVGDRIWAIGGRAGGRPVRRVDVYDPGADAWSPGPPLPVPMSAMGAGVLQGAIHVVGGEDPSALGGGVIDRHLVLGPGRGSWVGGPRPLVAVHGPGSGVLDRLLVVAGGSRRQGALSVLGWTGVTQAFSPAGAGPPPAER